jgi:hypothetical protein
VNCYYRCVKIIYVVRGCSELYGNDDNERQDDNENVDYGNNNHVMVTMTIR